MTRNIPVSDIQSIYRQELNGCNNFCRIHTPTITFTLFSLVKSIQTKFVDLDEVQAIILFGSVIVPRREIQTRYKGFWKWRTPYQVEVELEPKDIDILVILKNNTNLLKKEIHASLTVSHYYATDYSSYYNDVARQNGLHLFAATEADFLKSVSENVSESLEIIKKGVLLCGYLNCDLETNLTANWGRNTCVIE